MLYFSLSTFDEHNGCCFKADWESHCLFHRTGLWPKLQKVNRIACGFRVRQRALNARESWNFQQEDTVCGNWIPPRVQCIEILPMWLAMRMTAIAVVLSKERHIRERPYARHRFCDVGLNHAVNFRRPHPQSDPAFNAPRVCRANKSLTSCWHLCMLSSSTGGNAHAGVPLGLSCIVSLIPLCHGRPPWPELR